MKSYSLAQRRVILLGAVILAGMWLYPPWTSHADYSVQTAYRFLLATGYGVHSIAFGRLFVQTGVVCILIFAIVFALDATPRNGK